MDESEPTPAEPTSRRLYLVEAPPPVDEPGEKTLLDVMREDPWSRKTPAA